MEGRFPAFILWTIVGIVFFVMGIYDFCSQKEKPLEI